MAVVGANDLMTPVILSQEISDAIPRATLHVVLDFGHMPPIEKPQDLAALMKEWLRRT